MAITVFLAGSKQVFREGVMADFAYRASDRAGKMVEGCIEAPTREAALKTLSAQGLVPIKLDGLVGGRGRKGVLVDRKPQPGVPSKGRVGRQDVAGFTSELAVMLKAGLSLDRALKIMLEITPNPVFLPIVDDVFKAVKGGKSFSQALQPHQKLFGDFYINMVRSGEAGGQLSEVLMRLVEHLERSRALRDSVVSALLYPAILVLVATLSVVLMLGFVVPQFEALFADMGDALPLPTRVIVGMGDLVAQWWWLLAGFLLLLGGAARAWLCSDQGKLWADARALSLPLIGGVLRKLDLTRFARSFGTLLGNGVPIVTAISISCETMDNRTMRAAMQQLGPMIKQGQRLADCLAATELFSPLAINMARLGEETGRLDSMMLELAKVYDGEVQASLKRTLVMVEPLLILVLGAAIASIILAILMGIMSVNDLAM